jgi:TPR repeat protein
MTKNSLGECYHYGKGIKQDYETAFKWYFESAKGGCASGMFNLGVCYEYGIGIEKCREAAIIWYKKASDNGIKHAKSKFNNIM